MRPCRASCSVLGYSRRSRCLVQYLRAGRETPLIPARLCPAYSPGVPCCVYGVRVWLCGCVRWCCGVCVALCCIWGRGGHPFPRTCIQLLSYQKDSEASAGTAKKCLFASPLRPPKQHVIFLFPPIPLPPFPFVVILRCVRSIEECTTGADADTIADRRADRRWPGTTRAALGGGCAPAYCFAGAGAAAASRRRARWTTASRARRLAGGRIGMASTTISTRV